MVCEAFPLDSLSASKALDGCNLALGLLSVSACTYVFWGYLKNKKRPSLMDPSSMVVLLAISDAFLGLNSILEGVYPAHEACESQENRNICVFKACLSQFFGMSSFLWSGAMAHSSHVQISQLFSQQQFTSSRSSQRSYGMLVYHLLCWGSSFVSLIVVLATQSAGPASSHLCWVMASHASSNNSELSLVAAIVLFILPLVAVEVYNLSVFRWLGHTVRQLPQESTQDLHGRVQRLLAVLVGLKLIFLITRTLRLVYPDNTHWFWGVIVIVGAPLQGIGVFFIYRGSSLGRGQANVKPGGANRLQLRRLSRETTAAYSSVLNPLAGIGNGNDDPMRGSGSAHSGVGMLDSPRGDPDDDDDDEGGAGDTEYATIEGDSAHSAGGMLAVSRSHGIGNDGDEEEDDDFEEVFFDGSPSRRTGRFEHDERSRRMSDLALIAPRGAEDADDDDVVDEITL